MPFEISPQFAPQKTKVKYSDMIERGYALVDGRQCVQRLWETSGGKPVAACVNGALLLGMDGGMCGPAYMDALHCKWSDEFEAFWGERPAELNNGLFDVPPMAWKHIVDMARYAGL